MNYKLPIIEKYIQKNYSKYVNVVDFKTTSVYLGSSYNLPENQRTITQDVILITLNNISGELTLSNLNSVRLKIFRDINETFGLNLEGYGSKYELKFNVLTTMSWDKYTKTHY